RNRSTRPRPYAHVHHSPDPRNTLYPVSQTALPRTGRGRSDEPDTLRILCETPRQQTRRRSEDYPAALELQHRQASELQRPILHTEQCIPASRSGETASPANLPSSVRTQDAETSRGNGRRMDSALSYTCNLQDGS